MAIREILIYPDHRLRIKSEPVTRFDKALEVLVKDMAETMYAAPGIGLAAIQIDVPKRVVVMDLSEAKDALQVFINPEITEPAGVTETEEGCLSVPGVVAMVERAAKVRIKAQDIKGAPFEVDADEMLSVCIQHEVDHLNGKVFVDYLSRLKQDRVRKMLVKKARLSETEAA
ncbi:peptide deformylase [Candidatus Spongiihabitans sp.]|uniref:peptide deformylase n=1 Tax=Candidatus Spongiihabitans sp. TaxID=3101308 RepID=UPI003C7AFAC7